MAKKQDLKSGQVQYVKLSEIHADHNWNMRSGKWKEAKGGLDSEGNEAYDKDMEGPFAGLITSIEATGLHEPLVVRPRASSERHKSSTKCPYLLVSGFRRYEALKAIAEKQGIKTPDARVFVEDLNDAQARARNVEENIVRDDVKGADLCFAVGEMAYGPNRDTAHPLMTDLAIAGQLGKSQSYISKLTTIFSRLSPKLLKQWREMPAQIPIVKLWELSKTETDRHEEGFKSLAKAKSASKTGPSAKGKWLESLRSKAHGYGFVIGRLDGAQMVDAHGLDARAATELLMRFPEKKEMTDKQHDSVVDAFREGIKAGREAAKEHAKASAESDAAEDAD